MRIEKVIWLAAAPWIVLLCCAAPADETPRKGARLLISREGALLVEEGKDVKRFTALEDLAHELAGLRGEFQVEAAGEAAPSRLRVDSRPGRKERPVRIAEGKIATLELVRFLADYTGLPVILDLSAASIEERSVLVASTVEKADDQLVKRILEANHFRITQTATGPEGRVLLIESTDAPAGPEEPRVRPIVVAKDDATSRVALRGDRGSRNARGPAAGPVHSAGVVLEDVPEPLRSQVDIPDGRGILVSDVDEGATRGTGDLSALRRYDIVTNVRDVIVTSPAKFTEAINAIPKGDGFEIRVIRKGILTILRGQKKA